MEDVILTHAVPQSARNNRTLTWNEAHAPSLSASAAAAGSLLRTKYQKGISLDIDSTDEEEQSLPESDATPEGRKKRGRGKGRRGKRGTRGRSSRRSGARSGGDGGVKKRKKRSKGGRKRPKAYHVRNGKVKVYSSVAGAQRVFSASKLLSKISPSTVESAANSVLRSRKTKRKRPTKKRAATV